MTDFFGSVVNFFEVIANVITSIFSMLGNFLQTLIDCIAIPNQLIFSGVLPSILAVSVSIVISIGVVKLVLSIF